MQMIHILECDGVYKQVHPVPFWMTRYKLYSDNVENPDDYAMKFKIIYENMDGKKSILELANIVDRPFDQVYDFIMSLKKHGLVREVNSN